MKMDPENKSNKVKHFQTIEKKMINGKNTKGEKTEGLSYTYGQKNIANVVQIMGKKMSWLRFK